MRSKSLVPVVFALLVIAGCREDERRRPVRPDGLPDVVGLSLEDAKETLDDAGVYYEVRAPEGQTPLIDHLWRVCSEMRTRAAEVELAVDREC